VSVGRARKIVDRLGIALVYPIPKRPEIPSLWSQLYPKSAMSWSWDADADPRVAEVWQLREALARSGEVAYAKWFRGRATLFSLPVFHALLGAIARVGDPRLGLSSDALAILEALHERSPLSTKELRSAVGLKGREHERAFTAAMKALWERLLVVGVGEVDDGAFPSLAVAATELMFEDLWTARGEPPESGAWKLTQLLNRQPLFQKQLDRAVFSVLDAKAARPRTATRPGKVPAPPAVVRGDDHDPAPDPGISMRDEMRDERAGGRTTR